MDECILLPCPDAPPPPPEGGWSWFQFAQTKYRCPNGQEFEDGNFPFWFMNCSVVKKWHPEEVQKCVRKYQTILAHTRYPITAIENNFLAHFAVISITDIFL